MNPGDNKGLFWGLKPQNSVTAKTIAQKDVFVISFCCPVDFHLEGLGHIFRGTMQPVVQEYSVHLAMEERADFWFYDGAGQKQQLGRDLVSREVFPAHIFARTIRIIIKAYYTLGKEYGIAEFYQKLARMNKTPLFEFFKMAPAMIHKHRLLKGSESDGARLKPEGKG